MGRDGKGRKVPVRAAVEPARGSVLVVDFAIKSVNMHCSQEVMAVTVSDAQRQESFAAQVWGILDKEGNRRGGHTVI
jgi:hypothetical protein